MLPNPQHAVPATGPSPRCLERYRVLQEAGEIGSVRLVCQRAGVTRQTFYQWKKRYAASGMLGLEDRPSRPSPGRPPGISAATKSILLDHVRRAPRAGCLPLANHLAELGIRISPPTVQKYLNRWGLGSKLARVGWVRSGCPQVEPPGPFPAPDSSRLDNYEGAKSYYFFGIPKRDGGGREILCPSLEEVALALKVPPADIRTIADREHWIERRERLQLLIRTFEEEEWVHRTSAQLDSAAITNAALGLKAVNEIVRGGAGEVTPAKTLTAMKALKQFYKAFKLPFGGKLPVLFGPCGSEEGSRIEDHLPTQPGGQGRTRRLSMDSINAARRAFFLGIRESEQAPLVMKPSIRQVAEFLGLPVRPLQRLAVQQHWVATRRESDRWGGRFRAERIAHQVGRETILTLTWRFYKVAVDILNYTTQLWEIYPDVSLQDVIKIGRTTSIFLDFHDELVRDFRILTGYSARAKPDAKVGDLGRAKVFGDEAANSETASLQGILFKAIASTPIARQGLNQVQSDSGKGTEGSPVTGDGAPPEDFKRCVAYWMERWPRRFEIH